MSGAQKTWNDGEAVTTTELQRAADSAAFADDRVFRGIISTRSPAGTVKRVLPLLHDAYSMGATASSRAQASRLVCYDVQAVAGGVSVRPALYIVDTFADDEHAPNAQIVAHQLSLLNAPAHASNSSGVTRFDTIYAIVQSSVTATAARKQKDPTTGNVTTQTLNLEKQPTVSIGISPGAGGVPGAVPADGGGVYYFGLGVVAIQNGFVLGNALVDTPNTITQTWPRGGIRPELLDCYRPAQSSGGDAGFLAEQLPVQFRSIYRVAKPIMCTVATGSYTFDDVVDYRGRLVRIKVIQPKNSGVVGAAYPDPSKVALGGAGVVWDSGEMYYGDGATSGSPIALAQNAVSTFKTDTGGASTLQFTWSAQTGGGIRVDWAGCFTANGGFHGLVILEYTDPFWLPASVA